MKLVDLRDFPLDRLGGKRDTLRRLSIHKRMANKKIVLQIIDLQDYNNLSVTPTGIEPISKV